MYIEVRPVLGRKQYNDLTSLLLTLTAPEGPVVFRLAKLETHGMHKTITHVIVFPCRNLFCDETI